MSRLCTSLQCERSSRVLCNCCEQYLCLQHLNEHNASLVSQLNPLMEQIDALSDQFNSLLRSTIVFEQERPGFHRRFAAKMEKQKKILLDTRLKLEKLIRDQEPAKDDIEILEGTLNDLQREMNRMESNPTEIEDSMVQLTASIFSTIYKTIVPPHGSFRALGINDQYLLIHQRPNLCLLDTEFNVIKHTRWSGDRICDIAWCSILKQFILIGIDTISLLDQDTMLIRTLMTDQKGKYRTGTCFKDHLFLSTNAWGSSIVEFEFSLQMKLVKKPRSLVRCAPYELIDDIACHEDTIGIVIRNGIRKSMRMELRSAVTLKRFWSIALDVSYDADVSFHCSSVDSHGWLVADSKSGRLLQITTDGNLKQVFPYDATPIRTCLFSSDMLLVATKNSLNVHRI